MRESEAAFLERLADECARLLGPSAAIQTIVATDTGDGIRLDAHCATPIGARVVEANGTTIIDAAHELLARLPEERLAVAFRQLVAEPDRSRPSPADGGPGRLGYHRRRWPPSRAPRSSTSPISPDSV